MCGLKRKVEQLYSATKQYLSRPMVTIWKSKGAWITVHVPKNGKRHKVWKKLVEFNHSEDNDNDDDDDDDDNKSSEEELSSRNTEAEASAENIEAENIEAEADDANNFNAEVFQDNDILSELHNEDYPSMEARLVRSSNNLLQSSNSGQRFLSHSYGGRRYIMFSYQE